MLYLYICREDEVQSQLPVFKELLEYVSKEKSEACTESYESFNIRRRAEQTDLKIGDSDHANYFACNFSTGGINTSALFRCCIYCLVCCCCCDITCLACAFPRLRLGI